MNRIAQAEHAGFDLTGSKREKSRSGDDMKKMPKQRVNISEGTLMRIARFKLSHAVQQKLAYDQRGLLLSEGQGAGQLLSAKA